MRRPKIIHYISELNIGGAERQLLLLLPALQEYTDNHVICAIGAGPIGPRLYQQGIPVHYLDGKHRFDIRPALYFHRLVRHIQPDIITSYLSYADLTARFILAGQHHTLVSSQRSSYLGQNYLRQLDRLTKHRVHHYVCQTDTAHQQLHRSHNLHPHQCTVIPNAVEISPSHEGEQEGVSQKLRTQLGLTKNDIIITCVATLKPGKGHADLIQAFHAIRSQKSTINCQLLLVGDGPLREDLYAQAQNVAPEHIHFLGHQDNIQDILTASDIFALPTHGEGMSNAILEAMAARLPVVTTNILPNQEIIIDGHSGFLCPPGNIQCLTSQLGSLITNPKLRQKVGQAAKDHTINHHHINTVAQRWNQLYQNLLHQHE